MITYEWNHNDLTYIEKKLGSMKGEARRALRDAVNKTAVSARKRLRDVALERYTIKAGGFNSRTKIDKATLANPTATIKIQGKTLTLQRYRHISPKSGAEAQVLNHGGLKQIVGSRDIRAFVSKVASGKSTTRQILQRRGSDRYPLKVLRGPSVPKQVEMVYDGKKLTSTPLKEEIELLYRANVEKQIERFLNK